MPCELKMVSKFNLLLPRARSRAHPFTPPPQLTIEWF